MNLKKIRIEKRYPQQEIANFLKISRQAYTHYEKERRKISIDMLKKLSNLYNVSVGEILDCSNIKKSFEYSSLSNDKKNAIAILLKLNTVNFKKAENYIDELLEILK